MTKSEYIREIAKGKLSETVHFVLAMYHADVPVDEAKLYADNYDRKLTASLANKTSNKNSA